MTKQIENGKIIKQYNREGPLYCKLAVEDMHGEYPLPTMEGIKIREIWNGNDANDILAEYIQIMGKDGKVMPEPVVSEEILEQVMQAMLGYGEWRSPRPIDGIDCPTDTIIQIDGKVERMREWAVVVAYDLIKESAAVGGDDTYYDYFPGYVYMFRSICKELELKELYDQTIDKILLGRYAEDDEDTIPSWD